MKKFTADFETCTWLEDETYVWAWALCEIGGKFETIVGTNIESFFESIAGGTSNLQEDDNNDIIELHD